VLDRHEVPDSAVVMFTALVVGVGAGLGAVVFRRLIAGVQSLAFDGLGDLLSGIAPFHLAIIPAIGGLIIGPLIYRFAKEAKGHGVPEVMEAVALRGGRIRPRVAVIKSLASAICIGTGGSVGREGPIAQIGSALGSTVGQVLHLSDRRVRNLVACGTAGGIAATFNAPIAGSIFALEVILGQFRALYFGAVVISAVTADVVAHIFEGDLRAFVVPDYTLVSPSELVLYTLLGTLAGVAAVAFTRLLYLSEDVWDRIRFPEYLKPAVGGLVLGVVGILSLKIDGFPRVFGVGYDSIGDALFGRAGAYALVGMSAFFSGAAHAPITSILILFEMTGNYSIILPLMLATVMSTFISRLVSQESIYTLKLTRRGVRLQEGRDVDVMHTVTVGEAMTTRVDVVAANMPLQQLADEFARTHHHGFPVLDSSGDLVGVVTIQDLERALEEGATRELTVADIASTDGLLIAYPQEPMSAALRRLGINDVGRLPVVEKEGSRRLVGAVRRSDIIRAYNRAIVKRGRHQHRIDALQLGQRDGMTLVEIEIPTGSPAVGRRVSHVSLPAECLIVSLRRGRKHQVVHGDTLLQAGDVATVFAGSDCMPLVRQRLIGTPAQDGHAFTH
jgi:CIC family chloride channel protein